MTKSSNEVNPMVMRSMLLFFMIPAANLLGALAITVEVDPPSAPGTSTQVTVSATSNSGDVVSAFNFPIDMGADGNGLPTGFTFGTPVVTSTLFNLDSFNTGQNATVNIDGIINMSSVSALGVPLTALPTTLLELNIDIGGGVGPGTLVPINIINPTIPVNFFTVAGPGGATPMVSGISQGSVSTVPEPSSVLLVGLIAASSMGYRKLRRGRKAQDPAS